MLNVTSTYRRTLDGGLLLRAVENAEDVERLAAFNGLIHGSGVVGMTRELILSHPATRPEHWLFVEEQASQTIVSSLCLLPWTWQYQGVTLRSGEMGIVGTLEAYRKRGLIRALNQRFTELLHEGEFEFSQIQGIPYFYRQFGYEYAMPLEAHWRIELDTIEVQEPAAQQRFRPATDDDIPLLARMYDENATTLDIRAVRDAQMWRYLLGQSKQTEMAADTWLVLAEDGAPAGYLRVAEHGFGTGLIASETSRLDVETGEAVLRFLKALAVERRKPYIRLNLPSNSLLVELARWRGNTTGNAYAWQLRVPDPARLFRILTPVLERRLAASPLAGLSCSLRIDLYRTALVLHFEAGRIVVAADQSGEPDGTIRMPPPLLAPLVTGYRGLDELARFYPDVWADGTGRSLAAILFPAMQSFLFTMY